MIVMAASLSLNSVSAKVMNTRQIQIRAQTGSKDTRSMLPVQAWSENQTVYVTFLDMPNTATVTIVSTTGSYCRTEAYQSPETVSLTVGEAGTFEIEISYESKVYVGKFELE